MEIPLIFFLTLFVGSVTEVVGHMQLYYPPPFNASNNPFTTGPADSYLQYPYNCCGRTTPYPCRGYLNLLGTPAGAPVAIWGAGSVQNFNLTGIGNHWGGSCQVGFSIDNGTSFQVTTSYEGNCPHRYGGEQPAGQNFNFTVPADMPAGNAIFAWTWFNREQEYNMNCAAVTITKDMPEDGWVPLSTTSASSIMASTSTYTTEGCTCTCPANEGPSRRALQMHKRAGGKMPLPPVEIKEPIPDDGPNGILSASQASPSAVKYSDRPAMLVADDGNGCFTPLTTAEVKYPNPGPDVVPGDGVYPLELPTPADKCGYRAPKALTRDETLPST